MQPEKTWHNISHRHWSNGVVIVRTRGAHTLSESARFDLLVDTVRACVENILEHSNLSAREATQHTMSLWMVFIISSSWHDQKGRKEPLHLIIISLFFLSLFFDLSLDTRLHHRRSAIIRLNNYLILIFPISNIFLFLLSPYALFRSLRKKKDFLLEFWALILSSRPS